jgi:asparagine synthetase B (glutamine-hydrolysing)
MRGICGEIRFDGRSADVAAVEQMTAATASRGPDSDGIVAHGPEAFGHRRLSIIDLSARGAPNEGRTTLGANSLWQLGVLEMWLQNMEN